MPANIENIFKDLVYRDNNSLIAIAQIFQQISELGSYYETKKNKFQALAGKCGLALFFSVFFGILFFIVGDVFGFPWIGLFFVALFILLVILTIYISIQAGKYSKLASDRVRRELPGKLLATIDRDLNRDKSIAIESIFSSPTDKSKQISKGPHPYRKGWEMKQYQDPWLNISGEFLDGSDFQISIVDFYRISSGWKPGRRGKMKHKSKTKFKCAKILVSLKYSQRKYGAIQLLKQDILDAIQLPSDVTIKRLKIDDERIILVAKSPTNTVDSHYQTIVSMFLSLYQALNLARMLSKKKS